MNQPIAPGAPPDTSPPTAPGGLGAAGGMNEATPRGRPRPTTSASRGTTSTARPRPASLPALRIALRSTGGTSYTDSALAAGIDHYKVTAEDGCRQRRPRLERGERDRHGSSGLDATQRPGDAHGDAFERPGCAQLGAATDNVAQSRGTTSHRSTTAGFTPSAANRIAQPTGTTYTDTGSPRAPTTTRSPPRTQAGNVGPASNEVSVLLTVDTTPPTVSVTAPTSGSTLSGVVTVTANASDASGVAGVQFRASTTRTSAQRTRRRRTFVSWDTRGELDGTHTVRAIARDIAGNTRTSSAVTVTVANPDVSSAGLRVAYGFDDGSGAHGTRLVRQRQDCVPRRSDVVDERQVRQRRVAQRHERRGRPAGARNVLQDGLHVRGLGAQADEQGRRRPPRLLGRRSERRPDALGRPCERPLPPHARRVVRQLPRLRADAAVGQWQHVAATYDGTTARVYIDGVETASTTFTANVGDSNTRRIGAYGSPAAGFFDGLVDNVRIYDRALSASEVQLDMVSRIQPEKIPPTVTAKTPANGASGLNVGASATATFSEAMTAARSPPRRSSEGRIRRVRRDEGDVQLLDLRRDTDAAERAAVRHDLHVDRQGWNEWREGPRRQPARRRRHVVVQHRGRPAADPRGRLDDEPVRDVRHGDHA